MHHILCCSIKKKMEYKKKKNHVCILESNVIFNIKLCEPLFRWITNHPMIFFKSF